MVTIPVRESGGGIEDGATIEGTITGTETDDWTSDDGPVLYYQINIDWDVEGWERNVGYNLGPKDDPHITTSKEIGQLVERFGTDLESARENGEEIDLDEIFAPGTRVAFEVEEDTFEGDEGEDVESFNIVKDSLRPEDAEAPESAGGGDSQDSDAESENITGAVLNIVEDAEEAADGGADFDEVRKTLLQEGDGKEYWNEFQDLTDEGDILVTPDDQVYVTT